jgi:phosphoglycolate phosphatase
MAYAGGGISKTIAKCIGGGVLNAKYNDIVADCREHYSKNCMNKTQPFLGIDYLLDGLIEYGFKLAVVTNKAQEQSEKLINHFFPDKISVIVGGQNGLERKPSPQMLEKAAQLLGESVSSCVYIGDTQVDIESAKNAGMEFIGVSWGFRKYEQLFDAGAAQIANMPFSIPMFLFEEEQHDVQVPDSIRDIASAMDFGFDDDDDDEDGDLDDQPGDDDDEDDIIPDEENPFSGDFIDFDQLQ